MGYGKTLVSDYSLVTQRPANGVVVQQPFEFQDVGCLLVPLPEPHSLTFKAFSPEYCQQLRSWFTTPEQIIFWSGYKFGHPATLNEFANQLKLVSIPAYAMLSADGQLIGFGQMMFDNGRCHLVRVAVSPAFRGQGYGKMLLNCLYLQGQKLQLTKCLLRKK